MQTLGPLASGVIISGIGGIGCALIGLPAPWIAGGTALTAAAALSGVRMDVPARLRDVVFVLLGLTMGAGVTPETVAHIHEWPLSLIVLIVTVIAIVAVTQAYLTRVARLDPTTALFSAVPGALSSVMALALAMEADVGRIALQQSVRLLLLVVALPLFIAAIGMPLTAPAVVTSSLSDLLLTVGVGGLMALAFQTARVPGGLLNGAFVASAVLHATGVVTGGLPLPVQIACYVVLSANIGARLYGISMRELAAGFGHALASFTLANGLALAGVGLVVELTGAISFGAALLAFAPGGLEAMTALAFALNIDPAYVATHHFVRFIGVALALPLMVSIFVRTPRPE
jgi:membrane AbrB-like protein